MTELDDGELMRSLVRGEAGAFTAFYERCAPKALLLAYELLRDWHSAEDMVQQSFLDAWRHAAQFDSQRGTLQSWMLAIVRYSCLDELRSRGRRPQSVPLQPWWDVAGASDVWREVTQGIISDGVLDALIELPPPQRDVIELAYLWGYSHTQIADRLGLPLGTVKSRIRLGLRSLRWPLSHAD